MGSSSQKQETTQQQQQQNSSSTAPWQPTQGLLGGIINQLSPQIGNAGPNAAETGALNTLQANAAGAGNYGPQATALSNDLMSGGPDRSGYITNSYGQASAALSPYLSASYLDPMQNPGMRGYLDTIKGDITNQINGQFAGAGRDMSGMNVQSLARGLSQGLSGAVLGQYNQNVSQQQAAAGQLYGMGTATSGGLSALDQTAFGNRGAGIDMALNGLPAAQNNQANQILMAQAQARGLPLSNIAQLEALTVPLAGLGSQSSGSMSGTSQGTSTTTSTPNPWQVGIGAGLGLLGMAGGFPGLGAMAGGMGGAAGTAGFGVGSAAQNTFGSPFAPWYNR